MSLLITEGLGEDEATAGLPLELIMLTGSHSLELTVQDRLQLTQFADTGRTVAMTVDGEYTADVRVQNFTMTATYSKG